MFHENLVHCTEALKSEDLDKEEIKTTDKTNQKSDESCEETQARTLTTTTKDSGNVSSCIIEFKVVWFNFAAPPRAPITRKIDYTR